MARLESGIQNRILLYLRRARIKALNVHGSPFTESGSPDIFACIRGRLWVIEVKNEEGEPSKIQVQRMKEWHDSGAVVCLVRSPEELINCIVKGRGNWHPS